MLILRLYLSRNMGSWIATVYLSIDLLPKNDILRVDYTLDESIHWIPNFTSKWSAHFDKCGTTGQIGFRCKLRSGASEAERKKHERPTKTGLARVNEWLPIWISLTGLAFVVHLRMSQGGLAKKCTKKLVKQYLRNLEQWSCCEPWTVAM